MSVKAMNLALLPGLSGLPEKHLLPTRDELGWSHASRCKRGICSKPKDPALLPLLLQS